MNQKSNKGANSVVEQVEEMAQEVVRRLEILSGSKVPDEISYGQYKVLSVINNHGPISVGTLGRLVGSAQSTTSEMIARLTKAGLVTKVRGPYDGRVVVVDLTDQGRQLMRRRRSKIREGYHGMFGRLSKAEQDSVVAALKNLDEILSKLAS
ncbi:MAG: MarR family transcriptional regulator [Deltaproteobacteria bacterium]|nr:MarR family transcriptional regulator [Deltaproteobacteria bacterium]